MTDRVGARIAIVCRVGGAPNADRVENKDERARHDFTVRLRGSRVPEAELAQRMVDP